MESSIYRRPQTWIPVDDYVSVRRSAIANDVLKLIEHCERKNSTEFSSFLQKWNELGFLSLHFACLYADSREAYLKEVYAHFSKLNTACLSIIETTRRHRTSADAIPILRYLTLTRALVHTAYDTSLNELAYYMKHIDASGRFPLTLAKQDVLQRFILKRVEQVHGDHVKWYQRQCAMTECLESSVLGALRSYVDAKQGVHAAGLDLDLVKVTEDLESSVRDFEREQDDSGQEVGRAGAQREAEGDNTMHSTSVTRETNDNNNRAMNLFGDSSGLDTD